MNFGCLISILFFSSVSLAQTLTYDGTLFDSTDTVIAESGVKLKAEIFDNALVCVLYEREYVLDLSNSTGHFSLDLSAGTAPSAQPHTANTLTQVLSNAAGNNVTCANSLVRSFTGTFVKRQIRISVLEVGAVDITDIQLPTQDLEMVAFAGEAETSKKFTGAITGDVTGTSSSTKVTKIQGVSVDTTTPTEGQVLKYDNGSGKYIPSAVDSSVIADNSVSVADVDFASASGINIPALTAAPGTPSAGQIYYNSVDNKVYFYNGSGWINTGAGGGDFLSNGSVALSGNIKLDGNYLSGDGDNEGVFVEGSTGNVGIGTGTPGEKLDVAGKVKGTELCIGADCRSAWPITSSGGTITQVDAGTGLTGGSITSTGTIGLASTTVTAGSYGSATQVPSFTVDGQGRLTASANVTITDNDTTYAAATTSVAGLMSGADKTKLNAVESSATADQTAAEILTAVKTVDGVSSGLDADLLDGLSSASFVQTESDPTVLASVKDGVSWSEVTGKPAIPDGNSLDASDGSPANALSVDVAGNVGIGTTSPQSALQISGYTQLDTLSGAPPAADCNASAEYGRMKIDPASGLNKLYICTADGWQGYSPAGASSGASGYENLDIINSSQSWAVPADINKIFVVAFGGGGGGGYGYGSNAGRYGGSGGSTADEISVTPSSNITATIGAGGAGSNGSDGASGGTTTFSGLSAAGGGGGSWFGGQGAEGSGSGGTFNNRGFDWQFYFAMVNMNKTLLTNLHKFSNHSSARLQGSGNGAASYSHSGAFVPGARGQGESSYGNNSAGGVGGAILIFY